jgi:hypothetical protein
MSIDYFIWVPAGARNQSNGSNTKYRSETPSPSENCTRHGVSLTHGADLLIDERYFFEDELDARWFWESGYKERLFKAGSEGETCGYEKMSLWLNDKVDAQRTKSGV